MQINVFELKADTGCSNENVVIVEDINNELDTQNDKLMLQNGGKGKHLQSVSHNKDE